MDTKSFVLLVCISMCHPSQLVPSTLGYHHEGCPAYNTFYDFPDHLYPIKLGVLEIASAAYSPPEVIEPKLYGLCSDTEQHRPCISGLLCRVRMLRAKHWDVFLFVEGKAPVDQRTMAIISQRPCMKAEQMRCYSEAISLM